MANSTLAALRNSAFTLVLVIAVMSLFGGPAKATSLLLKNQPDEGAGLDESAKWGSPVIIIEERNNGADADITVLFPGPQIEALPGRPATTLAQPIGGPVRPGR